ncbi:MAG: PAS domain-containing protein [Planctomycetes bacterium]|nr:PAS domain-containing protein [Planctomycetota bacterium]
MSQERPNVGAGSQAPLYIVGIGASAGGFDPLERFFIAMAPDAGVAFVVVQHLSPDFKSLMRDLLERHTKMKVFQVENAMRCEANCVYLIPPKKNMVLRDGKLMLHDQDPGHRALQYPIDQFLTSLAHEVRERSIAVVLSGAGSDGARGVRAVNEAGGLVLVQSPETAQFDGMPRSALASGSVHSALPPDEIARAIFNYVKRLELDSPEGPIIEGAQDPNVLQEIVALLRTDSTIDFSHYRSGTISRRISRRISITGERGIEDYLRRLSFDAHERAALRSDLLIGVTSFFRDGPAWQSLLTNTVEPLLKQGDHPIRCWVTACSTGEEVYSLAMMLRETQERLGTNREMKIFATDIDKRALETAATGSYSFSIKEEVDPERLRRFFVQDGTSFRVTRAIRESVIFAEHNLNRDAPLTNMDIVTCRNALIYMEQSLQHRVLGMLHFALRVGGTMFLGSAETCGELAPEFLELDARWKIFQKRRNVVLRLEGRRPALSLMQPILPSRRRDPDRPMRETAIRDSILMQAFRGLMRERNSAAFLIGARGEVIHVFGKPQLFTRIPEGAGAQDFARLLRPELALAYGTALQKAKQTKQVAHYTDIALQSKGDDGPSSADVMVVPVDAEGGVDIYLVCIEDAASVPRGEPNMFTIDEHVGSRIQALEDELQNTRESLQSTIEELETANEEHQATNEELMASNEELQSTNEELQSVNEELYTVNAEHQNKIQELTDLNNDVENLLRNAPMSTLFLDQNLAIRKFTPRIKEIVRITEQDIGRPIDDFTHRLGEFDLWAALRRVLETGDSLEATVATVEGKLFLLRILQYQSESGRASGLVVTLLEAAPLLRLLERGKH